MVERIKNICDEKVFASVYKSYASDLYKFLYYKFGEHDALEDVVQEAFVKLWQHCRKITPEKARGFVWKTANNMMLNKVKHDKVVLNYRKDVRPRVDLATPQYRLEEAEFYERYQKALAGLTEEQRVAFLLNKVEGKKHREIAEMLGVTRKVVEYRIYSAFKKIKEALKNSE